MWSTIVTNSNQIANRHAVSMIRIIPSTIFFFATCCILLIEQCGSGTGLVEKYLEQDIIIQGQFHWEIRVGSGRSTRLSDGGPLPDTQTFQGQGPGVLSVLVFTFVGIFQ